MLTLDETFSELRQRLTARDHLTDRTGDPIYYFVFPPEKMLRVKEIIPGWKTKLEVQDGWSVRVFSLAARLLEFLASHKRRKVWLEYERENPFEVETFRKSLASALTEIDEVTNWVRQELTEAAKVAKGLLFLVDLEAVHPFLRIGTVEQALQGRCPAPLVIFYPGVRTGRTALKFLGVYPEDGNYRSIHIGD